MKSKPKSKLVAAKPAPKPRASAPWATAFAKLEKQFGKLWAITGSEQEGESTDVPVSKMLYLSVFVAYEFNGYTENAAGQFWNNLKPSGPAEMLELSLQSTFDTLVSVEVRPKRGESPAALFARAKALLVTKIQKAVGADIATIWGGK